MNLKALSAFCQIQRQGSLSAAAQAMNLSQPAVSRLVSGLEHEIGFALFHRDKRALRPTDEGRRFQREAERILAGIEQLGGIARDIRRGGGQSLRVVALSRLATGLLPRAAAGFARAMPEVALTVETHHRRDMERWLSGRQFDVGFGPLPIGEAALDVAPLGRLPAVAVVARDHPLAARTSAAAADLAAGPMIALTPDTLLQSQAEAIFAAAGAEPRVAMRVSSAHVAALLAAEGVGYAVADPITAAALGGRVATLTIEPIFWLTYGTLTPHGQTPSPAARLFAAEMGEALRALSDHAMDASDPATFALEA